MAKDKKDDTPNQQAEDQQAAGSGRQAARGQQPQGEPPQDSKPRPLAAGDAVELHCADGTWRRATVTQVRDKGMVDLTVDNLATPLVITSVPHDPTGRSGDCYREIKGK